MARPGQCASPGSRGAYARYARPAYIGALTGCVGLAILCRLPFLNVPLTNDEGGYAYVARLWAHGAQLYGGAWVDRPQGLVVLFRLIVAVAPSTADMRLFAAVYAGLSALLLAYVGSRLFGAAAGLVAAALYDIFSSGPQIEGFIVNGELLATLPAVASIALLLRARGAARAQQQSYLFLSGFAAGCALLVKQSAIDSAVIVVLFAALATPGASISARLRQAGLALAGAAAALALSAAWGAVTGWHQYIDAVLLDNLRYRSFDASSNTLSAAMQGFGWFWSEDAVLVVMALLAVACLLLNRSSKRWPAPPNLRPAPYALRLWRWLPLPWLAAATGGVMLGGLYSRHYFVQLLPPLCLLAAAGVVAFAESVRRRWMALLLVVPLAALGMTIQTDAPYYTGSPLAISQRLYGWPVYAHQAAVVDFLRQRVPSGQLFFVAYAAAPLHYLTGRPSVTRYLWRRPLGTIPGAYAAALRAVQRAEPVCVIPVQPVDVSPGDERMAAALRRNYAVARQWPGLTVLCRRRDPRTGFAFSNKHTVARDG